MSDTSRLAADLPIAAQVSIRLPAGEEPTVLKDMLTEASGRKFRRLNRFTELALLGAYRCIAQLPEPPPPGAALFLASDFGPVAVTSACRDAVFESGIPPKPVHFINVSGNMAGYYVAEALGLNGPNLTICRGSDNFASALELAMIELPNVPGVLVGRVDECTWPLDTHRERMWLPDGAPMEETSDWLYLKAA